MTPLYAAYALWLVGLRWYATMCGLDLATKDADHD